MPYWPFLTVYNTHTRETIVGRMRHFWWEHPHRSVLLWQRGFFFCGTCKGSTTEDDIQEMGIFFCDTSSNWFIAKSIRKIFWADIWIFVEVTFNLSREIKFLGYHGKQRCCNTAIWRYCFQNQLLKKTGCFLCWTISKYFWSRWSFSFKIFWRLNVTVI